MGETSTMKPENKPVPKVQAGINWGAFATVVAGVTAAFYPELYARVPDTAWVALGVLIGSTTTAVASWMKPNS